MQKPRTVLCAGQHVEARTEPWLVLSHEAFERSALVTLRGVGADNLGDTERLLTPFDRIVVLKESTAVRPAARAAVLEAAAAAVAESPAWRDCWTAATARIDLRAWQLEPALAAIRGESRILLADEVGLGKTIQAGLIVGELMARSLAERVLVLTPASLRHQWASELSDKFAISSTIFDHSSLRLTAAALPPGVNPWRTAPVTVSSIDLVKRPEVRSALEEVPIDVLVVDEAHHLTPGSDRAAVVSELAARTPWVVLATATPHSGDPSAYQFLCGLGSGGDPRPPLLYRRARSEVGPAVPRRVRLFSVMPTLAERRLLDATLAYARALWRIPSAGVHLVASVVARRAASSALAARQSLERRLALLERATGTAAQAALPWDEGDHGDAPVGDDVLGLPGLGRRHEELAWLRRLVALAGAASIRSSKLEVIRRLLRRTTEPLIIFSEYRDVVVSAASAIADLASVVVIHGGLSGATRRDLISLFTDGRARVLVTTDAAGEGLNLQERCRLVVNLELPWNPIRLEQRIGRVDRFGQRRTVHAIHLFHRESFEDLVLGALERRRARAVAAVSRQTHPELCVRADIERRLRACGPHIGRSRRGLKPLYARHAPRNRIVRGVVLCFGVQILDSSGRMVQRELLAIHVALHTRLRTRRLTKAMVGSLAATPGLRAVLDREVVRRVSRARADTAATAAALDNRARQILNDLSRQDREPRFQGSLFDRRSEQQSRARAAAILAHSERCRHRLASASALTSLGAGEPRLIAAWPVG